MKLKKKKLTEIYLICLVDLNKFYFNIGLTLTYFSNLWKFSTDTVRILMSWIFNSTLFKNKRKFINYFSN